MGVGVEGEAMCVMGSLCLGGYGAGMKQSHNEDRGATQMNTARSVSYVLKACEMK